MKIKKTLNKKWQLGLGILGIIQSNAAVLSYNIFDGDLLFGGPSVSSVSAASAGNDLLYTVTSTGDLDGLATTDDTITIVVRQSQTDSLGAAVATVDAANKLGGDLVDGNTFRFAIDSIVYDRGEAFTETTSFLGFDTFGPLGDQGGVNHVGTSGEDGVSSAAWSNVHGSNVLFGGTGDITGTAFITNGVASPPFTTFFRGLTFQVNVDSSTTPVPEPSSSALVALAGIGFIARRKR